MSLSVKRLMRDYKYVKNENLEEQGLYCIMNEENIYEIKAMVVGPKDTPYEGGFYFFLLKEMRLISWTFQYQKSLMIFLNTYQS